MNATLAGAGVIITRPAGQCEALAELVGKAGGLPLILPSMTIEAAAAATKWPDHLASIDQYTLVIFISQNAARLGAHYFAGANRPLAAVGPSTARSLQDLGLAATVVPAGGFTSEALLAHPDLAEMRGQRVLIVRGEGGRELLADTLRARGAVVEYLEVYCRSQAKVSSDDVARIRELLAAGRVQFVTATSMQVLENTLDTLGPRAGQLLEGVRLVSASERVLKRAQELGMTAADPAPGPTDMDLLQHMLRLSTKQASEHS